MPLRVSLRMPRQNATESAVESAAGNADAECRYRMPMQRADAECCSSRVSKVEFNQGYAECCELNANAECQCRMPMQNADGECCCRVPL